MTDIPEVDGSSKQNLQTNNDKHLYHHPHHHHQQHHHPHIPSHQHRQQQSKHPQQSQRQQHQQLQPIITTSEKSNHKNIPLQQKIPKLPEQQQHNNQNRQKQQQELQPPQPPQLPKSLQKKQNKTKSKLPQDQLPLLQQQPPQQPEKQEQKPPQPPQPSQLPEKHPPEPPPQPPQTSQIPKKHPPQAPEPPEPLSQPPPQPPPQKPSKQKSKHRHRAARAGHAVRKVVGSLVSNMEHVIKDIQGIMGDIKTLVVQIDTVTDKIDAQCSTSGGSGAGGEGGAVGGVGCGGSDSVARDNSRSSRKPEKENHVVTKPRMIDCQTYWTKGQAENCEYYEAVDNLHTTKSNHKPKVKVESKRPPKPAAKTYLSMNAQPARSNTTHQSSYYVQQHTTQCQPPNNTHQSSYYIQQHTTHCQATNNAYPTTTSSHTYEVPVFPANLSPANFLTNYRLDSPNKLSNVERWLIQENARHQERLLYQSKLRSNVNKKTNKSVKFSDKTSKHHYNKKEPFHPQEIRCTNFVNVKQDAHTIRQPCAKVLDNDPHNSRGESVSVSLAQTNLEPEYSNISYDEIKMADRISHRTVVSNSNPDTSVYFLAEEKTPTHKHSTHTNTHQIRVYNNQYKDDTSNTDDSPGDSVKNIVSTTTTPAPTTTNEFNVIVPKCRQPKAPPPTSASPSTSEQTPPPSLRSKSPPTIAAASKPSKAFSPKLHRALFKSSCTSLRSHPTADSESHRYQSLESDLDSINENNDPRCMTPDMDWSYLSLMGNGSHRVVDKATKHVYQTIGSPVFQRRKDKVKVNLTKSVSFETTPEVLRRLICVENSNFISETPDTETPGSRNCFISIGDELSESANHDKVINHIYCQEVTSNQADYCGHYEIIADSILENISACSSLEDSSVSCENKSDDVILGDTYVGYDEDVFDEDWDIAIKPSSDYYFEDDIIEFSLPLISAASFHRIPTHINFFDDSSQTFDIRAISMSPESSSDDNNKHSLAIGTSSSSTSSASKNSNVILSIPKLCVLELLNQHEPIQYDDLAQHNESESHNLQENKDEAKQTSNNSNLEDALQFSLWDLPGLQAAHSSAISSTSSEEGSVEPMTSGSSNMSYGSVDVGLSGSDSEERLDGCDSPCTCRKDPETTSCFCKDGINVERDDVERKTGKSSDVTGACADYSPPSQSLQTSLRKSSLTSNHEYEATYGGSLEGTVGYNRHVNTWTAYAMVHVPADDISDSTSDVINDNSVNESLHNSIHNSIVESVNNSLNNSMNNSVNNSMTSSYFEADNSSVAQQTNQSILDAQ